MECDLKWGISVCCEVCHQGHRDISVLREKKTVLLICMNWKDLKILFSRWWCKPCYARSTKTEKEANSKQSYSFDREVANSTTFLFGQIWDKNCFLLSVQSLFSHCSMISCFSRCRNSWTFMHSGMWLAYFVRQTLFALAVSICLHTLFTRCFTWMWWQLKLSVSHLTPWQGWTINIYI